MRKLFIAAVSLLVLLLSVGCGKKQEKETAEYQMYYLAVSEKSLVEQDYHPTEKNTESMVKEIAEKFMEPVTDLDYLQLLPEDVEILDCRYKEQRVEINFNDDYYQMKNTREILVRAGIVKAFTQIPGVTSVDIQVNGSPVLDSNGEVIGSLGQDSFIEHEGQNINTYLYTEQTLYFANQAGDKLVKEKVERHYSSNVPLEKMIVEWLIKGPDNSNARAAISPDTKILGVSIVEGVCYVNLDQTFLDQAMNVQEKIPIYSIVNSLMDACKIHGVQISVEGETKVTFRETMNLNHLYKADYTLVEEEEDAGE